MQNVECLRCGACRDVSAARPRWMGGEECPRCGYLGWATSADLTEPVRRLLRERPPERRRLTAV